MEHDSIAKEPFWPAMIHANAKLVKKALRWIAADFGELPGNDPRAEEQPPDVGTKRP